MVSVLEWQPVQVVQFSLLVVQKVALVSQLKSFKLDLKILGTTCLLK